ncbi:flagellar hook-associated protein FlgK [Microaerobacter geothermalis]|uniref:flagellar hook-associated protein FlgK n=1 Tax=Microaerobacter geothermalis TaxID=674972 RepID=UPI001F2A463A|nr:flagellar hook-associated protein FlgK [Microaerobacter geothermalis]MCF6093414.1 flagellar hook-associated protein FlgK [Microaerobacter geothermalis]
MRSTFSGLEIGKRALFAQQTALSVTGHNIANANTEGYTRQSAVMKTTSPQPAPGISNARIPGQMGTGVQVTELVRLREDFLDLQFRGENQWYGYWEAKSDTLSKVEVILNEPSETGLQNTLDKFWQAWQDLTKEPESLAARAVVRQRGIAVAETFSFISRSLGQLESDIDTIIKVKVSEINSIATQIKDLNDQISRVVPHGYQPNDLYDQRDLLIDKLSKLVDVKVTPAQYGMVNVTISGQALVTGTNTVTMEATPDPGNNNLVNVTLGGADFTPASGELLGLMESRGMQQDGQWKGIIADIKNRINQLATTFTRELNTVHRRGMNMDDINARKEYDALMNDSDPSNDPSSPPQLDNLPFFVDKTWYEANKGQYTLVNDGYKSIDPNTIPDPSTADNMMVNPLILSRLDKIAAAKPEEMTAEEQLQFGTSFEGDGRNARDIAALKYKLIPEGLGDTSTMDDFYRYTISQLGVDSQEAQRLMQNAEVLRGQVDNRRQSVSGVSLDEEMANMIKFQQAYNAAARSITTVDEMLDRVINGMGRVGL